MAIKKSESKKISPFKLIWYTTRTKLKTGHEIELNCYGKTPKKMNKKFKSPFLKNTIENVEGLSKAICEKPAANLN